MPIRKVDTLEAIKAYELGEKKALLTPKQMELKERYERAFHYLYNIRQTSVVAQLLQKEFGVSVFTAHHDINCAMELYGNPIAAKKEALRYLNTENQNKLLQLTEGEIKRKKANGEDIIAEIETASRINERIAKINRLHEEDEQSFDPAMLERTQVFLVNLDPKVMERYGEVIDLPVDQVELPVQYA